MLKPINDRPEMSTSEHQIWREMIEKRVGIDFGETRVHYLSRRLWERMRQRRIGSYGEYYYYMTFNRDRESEWRELLELLVTGETSFFRHLPSFEGLTLQALPLLISEKLRCGENSINIWSAACSTGEETYSLAMALLDQANPRLMKLKVTGSDVSEAVLEKARSGLYKPKAVRSVPSRYQKHLSQVGEAEETAYRIGETVKAVVEFGLFNLRRLEDCPIKDQDVIFCQNVLIYFNAKSRAEVVGELCRRLKPGGYMFLAPGDMVGFKAPGVRALNIKDCLVYQQTG